MAKEVTTVIKLQVPAGGANPSPPVGPALGQHGLNIMDFCNALQKSMIFRPCCPNAGPTGGLGFAPPAGTCNLITVVTSFAILTLLYL